MGQIAGGFDGVRSRELGGGKPSREMGDDANDFVERWKTFPTPNTLSPLSNRRLIRNNKIRCLSPPPSLSSLSLSLSLSLSPLPEISRFRFQNVVIDLFSWDDLSSSSLIISRDRDWVRSLLTAYVTVFSSSPPSLF
ncbi:hypothetical protein YC2023_025604 [Brassica napus]